MDRQLDGIIRALPKRTIRSRVRGLDAVPVLGPDTAPRSSQSLADCRGLRASRGLFADSGLLRSVTEEQTTNDAEEAFESTRACLSLSGP